ncbi:MAG: outer membrane beta-barrel protein, partial [Campylobacterota bacterium]|nr:outer membrane beta-barrel protein [Campylobacterota bacterium]
KQRLIHMKFLLPFLLSTLLYSADSGVYVEVYFDNPDSNNLKTEHSDINYEEGVSGTVAVGYQMDRWRFEAESSYSDNPLSSIDDTASEAISGNLLKMGGLANIYYSAYNDTQLVSTVGIGIGATNVEAGDDDKKTAFTYQGNVSLGYMVDKDWTWTIKYRYLEMKDIVNEEQAFSLGLRYLF